MEYIPEYFFPSYYWSYFQGSFATACEQTTSKLSLKFHHIHGENVALDDEGRVARYRSNVHCRSLVFSNRPIELEEVFCIKLSKVGTKSIAHRLGLTNIDPTSFQSFENVRSLLKQDVTYWEQPLGNTYAMEDSVLHFYLKSNGRLYADFDGYDNGSFLHGIDIHKPLWLMISISGTADGSIELLHVDSIPRSINRRMKSQLPLTAPIPSAPPLSDSESSSESASSTSNDSSVYENIYPKLPSMSPASVETLSCQKVNYKELLNYPMCFSVCGEAVTISCGHAFGCTVCHNQLISNEKECPTCQKPILKL